LAHNNRLYFNNYRAGTEEKIRRFAFKFFLVTFVAGIYYS